MTEGRWTPEDAFWGYRDFWAEELARIADEEQSLVDLMSLLNDLRQALFERTLYASRVWDLRTAQMMLVEIERLVGYWSAATNRDLVKAMEKAWDSGASQVNSVFRAAGLQVSVAPFISRTMLELATRTTPVLVSGIGTDLQTALGRELRRSVLAQ